MGPEDVAALVARPGGDVGEWTADEQGRPAFRLTARRGIGPDGDPRRCWHQIGNASVLATAHGGGWLELWSTDRGMIRLTGPASTWGPPRLVRRSVTATWRVDGAEWEVEYEAPGHGIAMRAVRRVTVDADPDVARLHIDVELTGAALPASWDERLVPEVDHLLVGALMSPSIAPPAGYALRDRLVWRSLYGLSGAVRATTLAARRAVGPRLVRDVEVAANGRGLVVPPRWARAEGPVERPAAVDLRLPWFGLFALEPDGSVRARDGALRLTITDDERAEGRAERHLVLALADQRHELDRLVAATPPARAMPGATLRLAMPAAPWLERETTWHGAYLLGARQRDAYFEHAYVSQGSAYAFAHGLHGAPRDYAIFSVPLSFLDPEAARDLIRVMLRLTKPSGSMHYAHLGRGQASSGGIHAAPTDLPLFLLWAITEHVWTTGATVFLDEPQPFHPKGSGQAATVAERVVLAWRYLRDRVGLGPHGLLRVGSGDWNDPISAMVPDRKAFHEHGESMFNTGFACHVLPRAADLIEAHDADAATEMRAFATQLRADAERHAWNGQWFLRGFDGQGGPVGDEHLFVDGQVWALIAGLGAAADRERLVAEIGTRCDDPSPIGATILDRPHPVRFGMLAPGWDCNGGVWAAVNALLAWGISTVEPERAWRLLAKQSLAAHATAYPRTWFGVWSGPDAYNAHFGAEPGGTFVQPATPMAEFPVMNANAHAGPLLALLRVLGVETGPTGVSLVERGAAPSPWTLSTAVGTWSSP